MPPNMGTAARGGASRAASLHPGNRLAGPNTSVHVVDKMRKGPKDEGYGINKDRHLHPEWKEQRLGMEWGEAPTPEPAYDAEATKALMSDSERASAERRSRSYWEEGRKYAKEIGQQLPVPKIPDEWYKDYEWRCWLKDVKKVRDSLRCASCYSMTPKDGMRVMMTCSRCKKVRYCSKACQKRDFKERHKNVCMPCEPPEKRAPAAPEYCIFCRHIPCTCSEARKAQRALHPPRDRDCE